jgi:hypothetical protein
LLFLELLRGCVAYGVVDKGSAEAEGELGEPKRAMYASIESFVAKGWNGLGDGGCSNG